MFGLSAALDYVAPARKLAPRAASAKQAVADCNVAVAAAQSAAGQTRNQASGDAAAMREAVRAVEILLREMLASGTAEAERTGGDGS